MIFANSGWFTIHSDSMVDRCVLFSAINSFVLWLLWNKWEIRKFPHVSKWEKYNSETPGRFKGLNWDRIESHSYLDPIASIQLLKMEKKAIRKELNNKIPKAISWHQGSIIGRRTEVRWNAGIAISSQSFFFSTNRRPLTLGRSGT